MYPIESPTVLSNAQEIFEHRKFANAKTAVVIKIRPDARNLGFMKKSFTGTWDELDDEVDLVVLSVGVKGKKQRDLYAGNFKASEPFEGKRRFVVDGFVPLGTKNIGVKHEDFYGVNRGGDRWYLQRATAASKKSASGRTQASESAPNVNAAYGEDVKRLAWLRKNQGVFTRRVHEHWGGKCAVWDHSFNGLLIASHIYPWRESKAKEKLDVGNGLLLSVGLDKLFDRGFISFHDDGRMIRSPFLKDETLKGLGLTPKRLPGLRRALSPDSKKYLKRHRDEIFKK
jgi:hypothetical protein